MVTRVVVQVGLLALVASGAVLSELPSVRAAGPGAAAPSLGWRLSYRLPFSHGSTDGVTAI